MNIYFAGSIRGGRQDADLYQKLIALLQKYGTVLTEHVGDKTLSSHVETSAERSREIHDRDMKWLVDSDVIVAEVTVTSLGVGYEIGRAVENGKKVICLYRPSTNKKVSAMIAGSDKLTLHSYETVEEAEKIFEESFT